MDEKDKLIEKLLAKIAELEKIVLAQSILIAEQARFIAEQSKTIKRQGERITELERRLDKNSQNSSKPPSSGGLNRKPQNNRDKSGKSTGGQKGHVGTTLQSAEPDEVISLSVSRCESCLADLSKQIPDDIEKRQVHDIPLVKIHITEYQAEKKQCSCGRVTCGAFPSEVKPGVQYGARIKGLALYLHNEQKLPYARCCEFLTDYYGSSFSEGSLFATQKKAHDILLPIEEKTKAALTLKKVLHHDETGMQVTKLLYWLHVASNDQLTVFHIHEKRGKEAMDEQGILPEFNGILVHDHWKPYFLYTQMQHGLCNAHHLRELKLFEEEGQIWAGKMRAHLKAWCHMVNEAGRENKNELPEAVYQKHLKKYQTILDEGEKELPLATKEPNKRGRPKQPRGRNLLHRLRDYQQEVLRFARDFDVPFTNNQAERDIRMAKLKQKISGGFRSLNGAKMFARLSGYLSTLRKQKINIAEAMTSLASGKPILPTF